jgi:hypothetical protein
MTNSAIERVRSEDEVARDILAGTDFASLPHDYPLDRMAADRMADLEKARQRIAELERELRLLRDWQKSRER